MRYIAAALLFALLNSTSFADEWRPSSGEIRDIVANAKKEMRRSTEASRKDDTCLTIELRARFKTPDLPADWCHTTAAGTTYIVQE
ncbi:MAG: hypothetical protein RLZZ342_349 [Candidatus Parcubacteria bacterium]|jgi:hypothetical protein